MNTPVQKAAAFSARAHRGQLRKDGRTPYASHPARVALIVSSMFGVQDEVVLAAALLHDVIEDCGVDHDELTEHFGLDVADCVAALSKDPRLPEPERERRYDDRLRAGPWTARLIKLADVYDNLADVTQPAAAGRLIDRAERAVALAGDDERLAVAVTLVVAQIGAVRDRLDLGGAE